MTNIKQKILKILIILLILQIIFAVGNISHASVLSNVINDGNRFLSQGSISSTITGPQQIDQINIVNSIYNILFPLGVAVTVIVGAVLGIKFMMASAEDKAKVKESLVPYAIGCAVIYGAFAIWKFTIILLSSIF